MLILGLDPGYDRLGWGVLSKEKGNYHYIACGIIKTSKTDAHPKRLLVLNDCLIEVIQKYRPEQVVVEKLFFATNAKTAMNVAEARGVILLACSKASLLIRELTPAEIKLSVTGYGSSDKKAVEKMVRLQLKEVPEKILDDTLDALAAALC